MRTKCQQEYVRIGFVGARQSEGAEKFEFRISIEGFAAIFGFGTEFGGYKSSSAQLDSPFIYPSSKRGIGENLDYFSFIGITN